jgi:hypothetical protein
MPRDIWNDDRIRLLKELWARGATAHSIADQLGGISRSAVMGKIFRLRLSASTAVAVAPASSVPPATPARRRRGGKRDDWAQRSRATAKSSRTSLLELTNESCRWLVEAAFKAAVGALFAHFQ